VADTPAPGIIGHPVPTYDGIPDPASVIVGPPGTVVYSGNPDISEFRFIDPSPIIIQFRLIFIKLGGQIGTADASSVKGIPRTVPVGKRFTEHAGRGFAGASASGLEISFRHPKHFAAGNNPGSFLSRGFHLTFQGQDDRLLIFTHIQTVETLLQDVKRSIRRVNFYLFFHGQVVDTEIAPSAEKVNTDQIISAFWKRFKIHLGIGIKPKKIITSEIDLSPAVSGAELVSFDDGKVNDTLFIPQFTGPLDKYVSLDEAETGIALGVIILLAGAE
jgi:hypothetical protein